MQPVGGWERTSKLLHNGTVELAILEGSTRSTYLAFVVSSNFSLKSHNLHTKQVTKYKINHYSARSTFFAITSESLIKKLKFITHSIAAMAELQQELQTKNKFEVLVQLLKDKLGSTSGINSDDVDPGELQELMAAYDSNYAEWKKYDWKDKEECYTRNLVDKGNGKSNLVRSFMISMKVLD